MEGNRKKYHKLKDHVIKAEQKATAVIHQGVYFESDHNLVVVKLRQKISYAGKKSEVIKIK